MASVSSLHSLEANEKNGEISELRSRCDEGESTVSSKRSLGSSGMLASSSSSSSSGSNKRIKQRQQQQHNKRAGRKGFGKGAAKKKATVCGVCGGDKVPPPYKCPRCLLPYCSLACFKEHKKGQDCKNLSSAKSGDGGGSQDDAKQT